MKQKFLSFYKKSPKTFILLLIVIIVVFSFINQSKI